MAELESKEILSRQAELAVFDQDIKIASITLERLKAKKRELFAGIHNGSVEYAKKMISIGFNLVTVGSDQRFMSAGAKAAIESIKGTKKGQESKGY